MQKLLEKYINGHLTRDEFVRLREQVSAASDEELSQALEPLWDRFEPNMKAPEPVAGMIRRMIGAPAPVTKAPKRVFRPWMGIAAALLLFAGAGLIWYHAPRESRKEPSSLTTVRVGAGDRSELSLPDGSRVCLNAGSTLSYPDSFNREITLEGEAYLEVAFDAAQPFLVHLASADIQVLGTRFNVRSYPQLSQVETTLYEGSVQFSTNGPRQHSILMKPAEKIQYQPQTGQLSILPCEERFPSWMEGELSFSSASFAEIISMIENHFNVTITSDGEQDPDRFTGSFREKDPEAVLKGLQLHYRFRYEKTEDGFSVHF